MTKKIFISIFILFNFSIITAQIYINADPFYLMEHEKSMFTNVNIQYKNFLFRPFLNKPDSTLIGNWSAGFRSELFYNNNAPNLENTSDRWIGKGLSFYQGLRFAYANKYLLLSFEPYYFSNQNKGYTEDWEEYFLWLPDSVAPARIDEPYREEKFSKLNDNRPHTEQPYSSSGLREAQIYLHYNGLGIGYSNANMWWGSGIHSSLNMTNNTKGFPHLMIGTIQEQRIKDFGINFRYIFADSLQHNRAKPFFTAISSSLTYYSDPIITVGFSRAYLSGGNRVIEDITKKEAMLIPFEGGYLKDKAVDIWDQTLIGYLTLTFPEVGLVTYIEYGRNDHAWDSDDLIRQPDHSGASIIGMRKYGFFGNQNLVGGLEYTNLSKSKFWNDRQGADWYDRWNFDYWAYDGKHWGAHSGPDSDDFYFYFGYVGENLTAIPSINYERHGVVDNKIPEREYEFSDDWLKIWGNGHFWPEVKLEYRLDLRYKYKGFLFNLYYEYEVIHDDQFRQAIRDGGSYAKYFQHRYSSVIWLGVERTFIKDNFVNFYKSITRK